MATANPIRHEVRTTLAAAAEVLFSDGVSEAFLDHWVDETLFMLSTRGGRHPSGATAPPEPSERTSTTLGSRTAQSKSTQQSPLSHDTDIERVARTPRSQLK